MRHRVEGRKLNRTASHRRALLRSLSTELIRHKRITTTEAKAKEAVRFVEAIISRAKRAYLAEREGGPANLHARRVIGRDIHDRSVVRELFTNIAPKVADRPGGYTRVVRIGRRIGDGAEMAVLELVDYNLDQDANAVRSRSKKLMSRAERVRRSQEKQEKPAATETAAAVAEETPVNEGAALVDEPTTEDVIAEGNDETSAAEEAGSPAGEAPEGETSEDEAENKGE